MTNYEQIYYSDFYNIRGDQIHVEFHQYYENAPSGVTPTFLRISAIQEILNYHDFFTPIIGTGLEITIQNEDANWNALEDLLVCYNREWYVVVTYYEDSTPITIFEGFLLPEEQEQQILDYSSVHLKASNQLAQLEELSSPNVDDIQTYYGKSVNRLIAYVAEFLTKTGLPYNIYVNCTIYETTGAKRDLLYDTYLHKHYFANTDLTYDNLYDALNKILLPFNLYVYLWNGVWYIDRIFDYIGPKTYVIYNPEPDSVGDYNYTESTGNVVPVITHGTDFEYVGMSQRLKYGVGYKNIVLSGEEKENPNLVNESFDDAIAKAYDAEASSYIGVWNYDNDGSITGYYDEVHLNFSADFRGISTKVLIQKTDDIKSFTISYRRKLNSFESEDITLMVYSHFMFNIIEWDHDPDPEQLVYNHDTKEWYTTAVDIDGGSTFGVSDIKYDPDGDYYYWEMNLEVSLDEIDGNGWHILEIKLMHCTYRKITDPITGHADNFTEWDPHYCNIRVTQYLNMEDFELSGQISTNYYNKLEQDLPLFDTTDIGAINMLMVPAKGFLPRLTTLNTVKSNLWTDDRLLSYSSRAAMSLQKIFLENMFQQYAKPRKELQATIFYPKPLAPFSIIHDDHITRDGTVVDFVVMEYTWDLNTMYYDIKALEIIPDAEYEIEEES